MPQRMRKIVSKCRPPFVRLHRYRHSMPATDHYMCQ
ncbi:unnamed protein product, partial [Rotaria sp. Silwood1]